MNENEWSLLHVCRTPDDLSSSSMESLDGDSVDGDLCEVEHEPEAWSVTVDRNTIQTMSARDIKRQDHIWGNYTMKCLSTCLSVW